MYTTRSGINKKINILPMLHIIKKYKRTPWKDLKNCFIYFLWYKIEKYSVFYSIGGTMGILEKLITFKQLSVFWNNKNWIKTHYNILVKPNSVVSTQKK